MSSSANCHHRATVLDAASVRFSQLCLADADIGPLELFACFHSRLVARRLKTSLMGRKRTCNKLTRSGMPRMLIFVHSPWNPLRYTSGTDVMAILIGT